MNKQSHPGFTVIQLLVVGSVLSILLASFVISVKAF
jgi:type II secretory pathway pseudopilin PulG